MRILRSSEAVQNNTGIPEVLLLQTAEKSETAQAGDTGHERIPKTPDGIINFARYRYPVQSGQARLRQPPSGNHTTVRTGGGKDVRRD